MSTITLSLRISPQVPDERLYPVVDAVIAMIQASGLPHVVGPSETTIEGEWDECMAVAKKAQQICFDLGATRVGTVILIDNKAGGVSIEEKLHQYR